MPQELNRLRRLNDGPKPLLSLLGGFLCVLSCSAATQAKVAVPQAPATSTCQLTEADKIANAKLSVPQFDYTPATPTNARSLANQGCYREAADAGQDYLARHQIDDERAHSNVIFHIGQNLAMSGDDRAASMMIAAAKRPSQAVDASFDWNTYVFGTWAFLQRNRSLLQRSYDTLRAKDGEGNQTNAKILGGLLHCFDQPYAKAYSPACVKAASENHSTRQGY